MKLGILGTGMIVKDLMQVYTTLGFEKTYILGTESTLDETKKMVEDNNLDGYFLDYDELLNADIDTVYVALPNFMHYEYAKKALESGKHVILEKPATTNSRELKELITLSNKKELFLMEAMNIHHLPAYLDLKKQINNIGDIKIVIFNYSQYSSRYDAFKNGITLPVFDPHKAGGALMDLNVYNIHALVGLFGKPDEIIYKANVEKGIDTSGMLMMDYGNFIAVTIGAKDCKAPVVSTIQGDLGFFRLDIPVNQLVSYEFSLNKGETKKVEFENKHRLIYEFINFKKMVEESNFDERDRLLNISLTVSEIIDNARKQVGVKFDND